MFTVQDPPKQAKDTTSGAGGQTPANQQTTFAERKERMDVNLTMGGIFPVIPIKAEYRQVTGHETIQVAFKLAIGYSLECWVRKTLFFKDTTSFNEEMNYILKFIAPSLLNKEYKAAGFKEYADQVCYDINAILQQGRTAAKEAKESGKTARVEEPIFLGKLLRKKNSQYVEFGERFNQGATFAKDYLALLTDPNSLYFTPWEIENTITPFSVKSKFGDDTTSSASGGRYMNAPTSATSWSGQGDNDDLPF